MSDFYTENKPIQQLQAKQPDDHRYLHTPTAGVFVPFLQSVVTALFVFIALWIVLGLGFSVVGSWRYSLIAAGISLLVMWLARQTLWVGLIKLAERATHIDLNNDGVIEGEEVAIPHVSVTLTDNSNGNLAIKNFSLPASEDQLTDLGIGLLEEGKSFSEKEWAGSDKPFSLNQFRDLRAEMITRGLLSQASMKDPRQGYILTGAGRALLRHYVPSPTLLPLPTETE